jgi:hypothetical protein
VPLGPATMNSSGWGREFSGCSVFLRADGKEATITPRALAAGKP